MLCSCIQYNTMPLDKLAETRPTMESNEKAINDLTEDLENLGKEEKESNDTDNHQEPNSTRDISDDFVDEDELKNEEASLTEEEKLQRKIDADVIKKKGNDFFKTGEYRKAIEEYTLGLRICPTEYMNERSILYSNRSACKMKLSLTQTALEDCNKAIEFNDKYVKAYVRRAQLYEQLEKLDESLEDYKKVLEIDPSHIESRTAVQRLPPLISERNEKLKTEMLGKLKDLGNMVLRPFGLSTANFEMKQDSSGGYSINFNQNPTE